MAPGDYAKFAEATLQLLRTDLREKARDFAREFSWEAVTVVRNTDHRRLGDVFVCEQHLLDLARVDVETTAKDHVLLAVDDLVRTVGVPHTDVARMEPAVANRFRGRFGALQVTLHDVVSANADLATQDLEGKKIGYTVPGLMDVLLDAFARLNGIQQYERINVGFAIVQSLTAGKVDAVMGPFKTYETVTMAHKGYDVGYFELEKWGIPDYDELVFVSSKKTLLNKEASLGAFQRVIKRAIAYTRKNSETALKNYLTQVPEADSKIETAAFHLTLPYYAARQELDVKRWQQFADFALQYGLVEKKVDVTDILWVQGR